MKPKKILSACVGIIVLISQACSELPFLNVHPDNARVVPSTLDDLQAILDNTRAINGMTTTGSGVTPILGEVSADDYYISRKAYIPSFSSTMMACYRWETGNGFSIPSTTDWTMPYQGILYANLVLDGLEVNKATDGGDTRWPVLKGGALFHRAHFHYQLAQVFCPAYQTETAASKKGIPLRLSADVNERMVRVSLEETYKQIVGDLVASIDLLPDRAAYPTRPSRMAAFGLLSRVYQTMGDHANALKYADLCLAIDNGLLDYNSLDANEPYPIPRFNEEVIYACLLGLNVGEFAPVRTVASSIDTILLDMYAPEDLRLDLFFAKPRAADKKGLEFRGSYDGNLACFSGIARDEIYLIRAEALARQGETGLALACLNTLLNARYKTGTFNAVHAADTDEALAIILEERRKQLLMRGLRWTDIKRLNLEPRFARPLVREFEGVRYVLPPNDERFAFPIPDDVIAYNPQLSEK